MRSAERISGIHRSGKHVSRAAWWDSGFFGQDCREYVSLNGFGLKLNWGGSFKERFSSAMKKNFYVCFAQGCDFGDLG